MPRTKRPSAARAPKSRASLAELRRRLARARRHLALKDEQLESAREDHAAFESGRRAASEQLREAGERLAAVGEELSAVNAEMVERSREAKLLSDDLDNILTSVDIPIVVLGKNAEIRRFTPAAAQLFHLLQADVGRPIEHVHSMLPEIDLGEAILEVIERLVPLTRTAKDRDGRWHTVTVRPYITVDHRIDGAIVVVVDVDATKQGEERIFSYQERLRKMAFDAALEEDRERRRIAADLHDGVGQTLALAQIELTAVRSGTTTPLRARLDKCVRLIEEAIDQTRTLTFEVSPPILYDLGFEPALRWLAEHFEKRYGLSVTVRAEPLPALRAEVAAIAFRAVRELLTNVFKHARVKAATVTVAPARAAVAIAVKDHGSGFSTEKSAGSGFGLFSVREQVERLGGTLSVVSAPHQGTTVRFEVPIGLRGGGRGPRRFSSRAT